MLSFSPRYALNVMVHLPDAPVMVYLCGLEHIAHINYIYIFTLYIQGSLFYVPFN